MEDISQEDLQALDLLNTQKMIQIVGIYSDILSYISTLESIEIIYSRYNKTKLKVNPDIPAVQSTILSLITRTISTEIGYARYKTLYDKFEKGEIHYSLKPNVDINIGNKLGIVSCYYLLQGVYGIYLRDLNQPIFGL